MTTRRGKGAIPGVLPGQSVETEIAALKARLHAIANAQQTRMTGEALAAHIPRAAELPGWAKLTAGFAALAFTFLSIGGIVWGLVEARASSRSADTVLLGRVATLERDTATIPSRVSQIETALETARRIRDQQAQGTSDRLRALELADQAGAERLQALAQTIAGILPRLEEILRRQERLESRLGARPGSEDGERPTLWRSPEVTRRGA